MLYIISGTEEEAVNYANSKNMKTGEWMFIPDSEYSMVWKNVPPIVIFIGTYRKRKDAVDRLLEHRDILLTTVAELESKLVYDNDGNLVTQEEYNTLSLNLEMVEYVSK